MLLYLSHYDYISLSPGEIGSGVVIKPDQCIGIRGMIIGDDIEIK